METARRQSRRQWAKVEELKREIRRSEELRYAHRLHGVWLGPQGRLVERRQPRKRRWLQVPIAKLAFPHRTRSMEGRSRPKPQVIAGVVIVGCRRSAYRQNGALVRLEIKSGRVTRHSERGPSRPRAVSCRQQPFHPTIQAYALAPPPRKHTGRDVAGWQHHASGDSTRLPRELSRRSPETDR